MGLMDLEGFGELKPMAPIKMPDRPVFEANEIDPLIVANVSGLVKYDVINANFSMGKLLTDMGIEVFGSNIYCPFHMDEMTGKPSAKYHPATDQLFCFSESKTYTAYHAIKLLYGIDVNRVFNDLWAKMTRQEREDALSRHEGEKQGSDIAHNMGDKWPFYRKEILGLFEQGKITFSQYKKALYNIFQEIEEEKENGKHEEVSDSWD